MKFLSRCSHPPTKIITMDGINYYGSDADSVFGFDGDIVLNLNNVSNLPNINLLPESIVKYFSIPFKEIMIPCPDGGLPRVEPLFWTGIHEHMKLNKYKDICIHCREGHGRTGTALSALLIANLNKSALESVNFIRNVFCEEAVETYEQCMYLQQLDLWYNNREPNEGGELEPSFNFISEISND